MAVNNSPLLTKPVDVSGLANEYRDGQQLRQAYDARQHQKALNDLMRVSDFNERLALAQQHKYAGALVPMVQQYEEARQKAALDNLGASADIQKTFAEAGKLGAETGKIGAETEGEQLQTAQGISDYISAAAVTQDPNAFGLKIGELHKRGLLTPQQTTSLLNMVQKDPQTAAKLMQRMAMGNPEIAKTFMPSMQKIDLGNRVAVGAYDPMTNSYEGLGDYEKGASPDNVLDNATSRYGADKRYASSMYATDVASQDRHLKLNQDGKIEWFKATNKAKTDKMNAETNQLKAATMTADGQPVRKLEANERKKIMELQDSVQSVESALQTLNEMEKLAGDDKTYSGFGAGMRAKIASNLGFGGEEADNTVVYDNMATEQALTQLKAIFGGTPTEGERKILLDIQASANKTPEQKKAILANAKKAAMRRLQGYNEQINGIATGAYLQPKQHSSATSAMPAIQSKIQAIGDSIFR